MGNPETAKKLFWIFLDLMAPKENFYVLVLYVSGHIKALTYPLSTWGGLKTS